MDADALKAELEHWITKNHPLVRLPGDRQLDRKQLIAYYDHLEVAMLQLNYHDDYPEFLQMLRKRRALLRRLSDREYKQELFRSMVAF